MNNLIYFNSWSAIHKLIVYPLNYNIIQLNNRYKKITKHLYLLTQCVKIDGFILK